MLKNTSTEILGYLGEDLPYNPEFKNVKNLNTLIQPNFPVFDLIAEKDDEIYVFSAKARNKFCPSGKKEGKLNGTYNCITKSQLKSKTLETAKQLLKENGYDPTKIHYCFIVVPLEEEKDAIYYWDELDLSTNKTVYISMTEKSIATYKKYGIKTWEEVKTFLN